MSHFMAAVYDIAAAGHYTRILL